MPVTLLDPKTVLILIDLQAGITALPTAEPADAVVERAAALAAAFRRHRLPVVLVNVAGGPAGRTEQAPRRWADLPADWAELVPGLGARPQDIRITKRSWGAFADTGLDSRLRHLGVTQLVIAGISTSAGVESTARNAHELGFNVTLAIDAMTDTSPEAHENSVTRIFPRIGETGTTEEIIALLDRSRADP